MFGFFSESTMRRIDEDKIKVLEIHNKNLTEVNMLLRKEKEYILNGKIEDFLKDLDINNFMGIIQKMAKEKIKNNDDVYLVSYYVDLYKFIEDLKNSYMNR